MQNESPKKAIQLMHKAVPLMLKLNIPPTPYNYGIWYEYASNRNPILNQIVDGTLQKLGNLPSFLSRELFHEFLLPNEFQQGNEQKKKLDGIVKQVESSSKDMNKGLDELTSILEKSRKVLKRADKEAHIDKVIGYLEKGALNAQKKAYKFNKSLADVQLELDKVKLELANAKRHLEIDELTQLDNQKGLERTLYSWLPNAEDDVSVILIDIDDLSSINQDFGKRAGTALIRYVADIIKSVGAKNTAIARIKGGTFALLINESTLDYAHSIAEQLRQQISEQRIRYKHNKMHMPKVTVSIGIATLLGQEDPEDLLERAYTNLKHAKSSGKNCTSAL